MSDSESTEISTTPAGTSTDARGTWSRKRQKREQAAMARAMKHVRASTTGESGPSSSLSGPRASSESASETPTLTGYRMTASEGGTSTGRETIGSDNPTTLTAHTTQSQTGDVEASTQPATPSVSPSWSRKRSQKERAAHMHSMSSGGVQESEDNIMSARDPDFAYQSKEEPEHDDDSSHEEFAPQELFDDWMVSLRLDQRKMLSVILMETFKSRMKMSAKDAATDSGSVVGFNEKTVRR